jgi:hypothetical protein
MICITALDEVIHRDTTGIQVVAPAKGIQFDVLILFLEKYLSAKVYIVCAANIR